MHSNVQRDEQARNEERNIKPVARLNIGKLLKLSMKAPNPEEFHDKDEVIDVSEVLAFDDLTGMKLDAGRVRDAREK